MKVPDMTAAASLNPIKLVNDAILNARVAGHEPDTATIGRFWRIARGEASANEIQDLADYMRQDLQAKNREQPSEMVISKLAHDRLNSLANELLESLEKVSRTISQGRDLS